MNLLCEQKFITFERSNVDVFNFKRMKSMPKPKPGTIFKKASDKETWISARFLAHLTGWSGEQMRQAREKKYLTYRAMDDQRGWEYLLESLNEKFILKVIAK